MEKIIGLAVAISLMAFLSACSNAAPLCSDEKTVNLVKEIALTKIPIEKDKVVLTLESIRTTDTNKQTGKQSCAGDLIVKTPDAGFKFPLTYTSEVTDKKEHYVTVWGL